MQEDDIFATLRHFRKNEIDFIVVGGVAAVLNGVPIHTFDLDLVYLCDPANLERIRTALQFLDTHFEPLNLLSTIGEGHGFTELLPQSEEVEVGDGTRVRVLNLETIISVKEQLASEKDLAVLPILRQTLKEIRRP